MLASMTGYGHASVAIDGLEIAATIKSLNSKAPNLNLQLPSRYAHMDITLRKAVLERLIRGKIEVTIMTSANTSQGEYAIDSERFQQMYDQIKQLTTHEETHGIAAAILNVPGVISPQSVPLDDHEELAVRQVIDEAMTQLEAFRRTEGEAMKEGLKKQALAIKTALQDLIPLEAQRAAQLKQRLSQKLEEAASVQVDKNRFEQEVIYYLERLDLNEEKERLLQHCIYFDQTLEEDQLRKGRTLNFVSQEMGREINTIGSKANDHQIQHLVVGMKEALDAIKEMIANVL